nr:transposase [Klebsiella pneumoniae]
MGKRQKICRISRTETRKRKSTIITFRRFRIRLLFFVTNTTLLSEKVVIYYEKRGNAENYIKEAKYDMAVGHLLLKSFWANEAVFQMMMLSYNLFLLFKFDSLDSSEYRQQIKTFRLKYVFLAAKIIKTARYVIMKLSENYPYKECMKNVWYNKNIINKIECCSVDNLQSLLSIIAAKMKSMIYQK